MLYLKLFLTFLKIGAFTFGGGYAMIPLIREEVLRNNWMEMEEFINFIAVSESTPGPFAINISTYVGTETGGFFGAICATVGVILPSFFVILLVARFVLKFRSSRIVVGCMNGLRPAVVGMIATAVISVGVSVFFPGGLSNGVLFEYSIIASLLIFVGMVALEYKKVHPILIIIFSGILGIIAGYMGLLD